MDDLDVELLLSECQRASWVDSIIPRIGSKRPTIGFVRGYVRLRKTPNGVVLDEVPTNEALEELRDKYDGRDRSALLELGLDRSQRAIAMARYGKGQLLKTIAGRRGTTVQNISQILGRIRRNATELDVA